MFIDLTVSTESEFEIVTVAIQKIQVFSRVGLTPKRNAFTRVKTDFGGFEVVEDVDEIKRKIDDAIANSAQSIAEKVRGK